jgi:LPXTG-site transpeptidase (sortase) family protein
MSKRNLPARFGLALLAGLLAAFALTSIANTPSIHAAGATLSHPSVQCGGSNATVAFQWKQLTGATAQYLDLSVQDGNFAPGTFAAAQVSGSGVSWPGLEPGAIYWWRINSNTSAGWQSSDVKTFVPCGNPQPLTTNGTCADASNASVDFFWAPVAGATGDQFLDISQDQAFPAGHFEGKGPIASGTASYRWANLKPNTTWYYRINQRLTDGTWKASPVKSFNYRCGATGTTVAARQASYTTEIYGSNDRFVMTSRNINAPVNVRDVGPDGVLGDPAGKDDVVRYNFGIFPGMGGTPGEGGTIVVAAHVDYRPNFQGPFWTIRSAQPGEIIEYYRDGKKLTYQVDWVKQLTPYADWGSLFVATSQESLMAITCDGTFNRELREYDARTVVHAVRIS